MESCACPNRGRKMQQQEAEIVNKLGLHARASAKLTQLAGQFKSDVWLSRSGRRVNAKSIMGVMMLAAAKGSTIAIETDGPDEEQAMRALLRLIGDKFGEGE
jgi:phosphocarrier protein HPr